MGEQHLKCFAFSTDMFAEAMFGKTFLATEVERSNVCFNME